MAAVEWGRISPAKAESVISMLLKNLYPDAERIWGAGGDGGRDVQIRHSDAGLDAFEIKGFTGIDDPYEPPEKPELVLDAGTKSARLTAAALRNIVCLSKRMSP